MTSPSDVPVIDQRTPEERERSFVPGMGKGWLLPLYDVVTRAAGARTMHQRTVTVAGIRAGQTVLDVGCGTGNLSLTVLGAQPDARVTGLDPEGDALRRAARKARRRRTTITLVQGYADRLPAGDGSLDHVVSSLALHHLGPAERGAFAREAVRALRPGGTITVADLAAPASHGHPSVEADHSEHRHGPAPALGHLRRHLRDALRSGAARTPVTERLAGGDTVRLLRDAGFTDAREVEHIDRRFGRVDVTRATRG